MYLLSCLASVARTEYPELEDVRHADVVFAIQNLTKRQYLIYFQSFSFTCVRITQFRPLGGHDACFFQLFLRRRQQ